MIGNFTFTLLSIFE